MALANEALLFPLIRPYLPKWWADRVKLDQAVRWAKLLHQKWDAAQLFAEEPVTPLFLKRLDALTEDVRWWTGAIPDKWGGTMPRAIESEREALLAIAALCLARLAAVEDK